MSITASWLILAVVLLRRVLQKAPKSICFFLWLFVGIRLVCPVIFESNYSLVPEIQIKNEISQPKENQTYGIISNTLQPTEIQQIQLPYIQTMSTETKNTLDLVSLASITWMIGVVLMIISSIISYYRLQHRVKTAVHREGRLWQCETVESPFILGFFRPRIYLPFDMKEPNFSHVIAHEQAHLRHFDHWIKPIAFLLLSVYWFNPIIWLAYVLLCRDIELACDERVIKEIGSTYKRSYSEALLHYSISRSSIAICPLAFGEVGVKTRIKSVLNYKKPRFWIILVAVVACIVVPICFLTNPKSKEVIHIETFGHRYQVMEINYSAPQYSFAYMLDTAPKYYLSKDEELMVKENQKDWVSIGKVSKIQLTEENFDDYFIGISDMKDGNMKNYIKEFREENQFAWTVSVSEDENGAFYYVLQQKNGDVYISYGYHPSEANLQVDSIRWLFHLNEVGDSIISVSDDVTEIEKIEQDTIAVDEVLVNNVKNQSEYIKIDTTNPSYFINKDYLADDQEEKSDSYIKIREVTSTDSNGQGQGREISQEDFTMECAILQEYYSYDTEFITYGGIVTLKKETVINPETKKSQLIVYAIIVVENFEPNRYELIKAEEFYGPVKVTFDVTDSEEFPYSLVEYWTPDEGKDYEQQIREQFPEDIVEDALDTDKNCLTRIQDSIEKYACTGLIDIKKNIGNLLETIMSSPQSSSNVDDYIKAHNVSYSELLYYGETTVEYIFEQFLAGVETGLKGAILKELLVELLGEEIKQVKTDTTNPQEYFDAVLAYAKEQRKIRNDEYMEKRLPHLMKLVEMEEES